MPFRSDPVDDAIAALVYSYIREAVGIRHVVLSQDGFEGRGFTSNYRIEEMECCSCGNPGCDDEPRWLNAIGKASLIYENVHVGYHSGIVYFVGDKVRVTT